MNYNVKIKNKDISIEKELKLKYLPNEDQMNAIHHIVAFIHSKEKTCVLNGSAGTGKTFTTKIIIALLKKYTDYDVVLAAPTHKAKVVLQRLSGENSVTTIHSLLGLKPNVKLDLFDAKNLIFLDDIKINIEKRPTLYIVDEASMINNDLYDLLMDKLKKEYHQNKILYLGDIKQLRPVKQEEKSKVFFQTEYPGFTLTKIVRQGENNNLLDYLDVLRKNSVDSFASNYDDKNGIIVYEELKPFLSQLKKQYSNWNIQSEPFKNKCLCYTNKKVTQFNNAIRKILNKNETIEIGDLLTGYDNYNNTSVDFEDDDIRANLFNSNDYVVIDILPQFIDIPYYSKLKGYKLNLLDTVDNSEHIIYLLDPELPNKTYDALGETLERIRISAINSYRRNDRSRYWSMWYKFKDYFATFKDLTFEGRVIKKATLGYGYAITVHKSQGSSYENVFIDMTDIRSCPDINDLRPLQYVSISRAQNYVYVYQ